MKDKLTRTRHGRLYYRAMSLLRGLGLAMAAVIVFSAPVVIAYGINVAETKATQETSLQIPADSTEGPIETASYEA